jgi:hypothetical protein
MPRVVHFEISGNDPEKVAEFYHNVFGWEISKWDGPEEYWLVNTGDPNTPGINGGIFKPKEPFTGTVNTVDVPNLEEFIERVKANHGHPVTDKITIPGVGYIAYCKDVEETIFGLIQSDPTAGQ